MEHLANLYKKILNMDVILIQQTEFVILIDIMLNIVDTHSQMEYLGPKNFLKKVSKRQHIMIVSQASLYLLHPEVEV